MPCFRCHARQTDPARGPSAWRKGVVAGEQVLICPACLQDERWTEALDRCPACRSTSLVKALGDVRCRSCGLEIAGAAAPIRRETSGLADEVCAAVERVLGRPHDAADG